jgi:predicted secreted acid phosphatase
MGVAVVFNTNRSARNAQYAERALNDAGLGPAVHGQNLFLSGDDPTGSLKDSRRWAIADRYCVLAMAGDQLGDISDRFNSDYQRMSDRRGLAALPAVQAMWGNGWFVFPNSVYGSALQGGPDDIFPADKQWRDPGPAVTGPAVERGSR